MVVTLTGTTSGRVGERASRHRHDGEFDGGAVDRLEAGAVRAWALASHAALAGSRERIDAVNVFPVPDTDTGTNVLLTVTGGVDALTAAPPVAGEDVRDVARLFARGALHAARGNSGVILSQYLTGFAQALPADAAAADVARCLGSAARAARESMQEPQEGTILTLADAVARSAETAADAGADLTTMLDSVVADAHLALAGISAEPPRPAGRARAGRGRVRPSRGARRLGRGGGRGTRRRRRAGLAARDADPRCGPRSRPVARTR